MEIKLYRWMLLLLAAGWCCELPSVHTVRLSRESFVRCTVLRAYGCVVSILSLKRL